MAILRETELRGSIRDALLGICRSMPNIYAKMRQAEQENAIRQCEGIAEMIVSEALVIITGEGRASIPAAIHGVKIKKTTVEGIISVPREHELATELVDAAFGAAHVVFSHPDKFEQDGKRPKAEPDQRSMPLDDGPAMFEGDERAEEGMEPPPEPEPAPVPAPEPVKRGPGRPKNSTLRLQHPKDGDPAPAPKPLRARARTAGGRKPLPKANRSFNLADD